jgi:hypothetical protein
LAESLRDLLPNEVVHQSKRTFTFPWRRWMQGQLGTEVGVRLGSLTPSLADVVNSKEVLAIWRNFVAGRTGWARPWSLFVLNEWVRCHIDQKSTNLEPDRPEMAVVGN